MWLFLAGALLITEMTTGSFYLLMVSLGALAGALAAFLGYGFELQIGVAAVFSALGGVAIRFYSRRQKITNEPQPSLDIGNKIEIPHWQVGGRGSAQYRGATWTVESTDAQPAKGLHEIVGVQGNVLKVKVIS